MTDDQFTKLEKYLDERFDIMEQRFNFTERYMRERFDALESMLDTKADKDQLDQLRNTVDGIAGHLDTIETELATRDHQTDRRLDQHQDWIRQLADHSHAELDPQL